MKKAGVIIISDKGAAGERDDLCMPVIQEHLKKLGIEIERYEIIPDEKEIIKDKLIEYSNAPEINLILTSGGTGIGIRDVTPEATKEVLEKEIPGIAEAMRLNTLKFTPNSLISRAVAGVRKKALIINLPGSPKACAQCLEVILDTLPHAIEMLIKEKMECG